MYTRNPSLLCYEKARLKGLGTILCDEVEDGNGGDTAPEVAIVTIVAPPAVFEVGIAGGFRLFGGAGGAARLLFVCVSFI